MLGKTMYLDPNVLFYLSNNEMIFNISVYYYSHTSSNNQYVLTPEFDGIFDLYFTLQTDQNFQWTTGIIKSTQEQYQIEPVYNNGYWTAVAVGPFERENILLESITVTTYTDDSSVNGHFEP
eukprot:UN11346